MMLRGAIEGVTPTAAFGWIYAGAQPLRDKVVLAFHEDRCIGAGKIEVFRADLAEAGLGDGHLGFHFGIDGSQVDSLRDVVIRLEGSDAVFLQRGARVVTEGAPADSRLPEHQVAEALSSLKWQLAHGCVDQAGYDFLRTIWQFGVYERVLREGGGHGKDDPVRREKVFSALLSLYCQDEVRASGVRIDGAQRLLDEVERIRRAESALPLIALWAATPTKLRIAEGSHIRLGRAPVRDQISTVGYDLHPGQIVLLDVRAEFCLSDGTTELELLVGAK